MTNRQDHGRAQAGEGLRDALRWLSAERRHDARAVQEACRRFDLSPLDEEFLLAEARRLAAPPGAEGDDGNGRGPAG
jgi:hypothetical protein